MTIRAQIRQCVQCPLCDTFSDWERWHGTGDDVDRTFRCPQCGAWIEENDFGGEEWGPVDERGRLVAEDGS